VDVKIVISVGVRVEFSVGGKVGNKVGGCWIGFEVVCVNALVEERVES
jgi:hypothetical protein